MLRLVLCLLLPLFLAGCESATRVVDGAASARVIKSEAGGAYKMLTGGAEACAMVVTELNDDGSPNVGISQTLIFRVAETKTPEGTTTAEDCTGVITVAIPEPGDAGKTPTHPPTLLPPIRLVPSPGAAGAELEIPIQ